MMQLVICLVLSYLALVAAMMGTEYSAMTSTWPAVVVVLTVRWFSPNRAAAWAFAVGLMWDSIGNGPLGLHAMTLVTMTAVLPYAGFTATSASVGRWMWAVLLTVWWDSAVCAAIELGPLKQWDVIERQLINSTTAAILSATAMGIWVGGWRKLTGASCATH